MTEPRLQHMIDLAKSEVGYREGFSHGHYNNHNKYSPQVPGLEWSQNQPWCNTFLSWLALKAGLEGFFPRTASVPYAAKWFKDRHQWSEYPAIGAQAIFGQNRHTGLVVDYDDTFVWTVEGNTNDSGSPEGNGVYLKKHRRRDPWVLGYGYPALPLQSADPTYHTPGTTPPVTKHSLGVDYSFARPDPAAIVKAGYVAVGRYLSHSPSKNLTGTEALHLHAQGLGIWLVWETTAKRAAGTKTDGRSDANEALRQAATLGMPTECPVFFAVDFDARWDQVDDYVAGVIEVAGERTGVYGSYGITRAARGLAHVAFTWQTMAWSGGRIDTDANLFQRVKPTVVHPVKGTDENLIQVPFPMWR